MKRPLALKFFAFLVVGIFAISLLPDAFSQQEQDQYLKRNKDGRWTSIKKLQGQDPVILGNDVQAPSSDILYPTTLSSSGLFLSYINIPVGSWPEAVAIGDVNSDGKNDVVMTTSSYSDPANDFKLFVFLQNGSSQLNSPIIYSTSGTYSHPPKTVAIGDVNGDQKNDVVVGLDNEGIEVFLQNRIGALNKPVLYPSPSAFKIKLGDFNKILGKSSKLGDTKGRLDVAGIGWSNDVVDVFLQNLRGNLAFSQSYPVDYGGYNDLEVGDVNGDQLTDIIVMSGQLYSTKNINVLLQNGKGGFTPTQAYDLGGDELARGVAVGDMNNDKLNDVIISYGGNRPYSNIAVFLQGTSGTLNQTVSYPSYDVPESIEATDVNCDGLKDIIVLHGGWSQAGVYLQQAAGGLAAEELYPITYASHYNPHGLAVGDINGDKKNDIVIADYNNGLVILYNNCPGSICP